SQVLQSRSIENVVKQEKSVEPAPKSEPAKPKSKKLSYKLQRELETLPQKLEELEAEIESMQEQVNDADFFSQSVDVTQPILDKLTAKEQELEIAFERWEEL